MRVLWALLALLALPAAAAQARTVVTIEFDVATADQMRAIPLLDRHGMKATFFVNSGLIGEPAHLTWPQLRMLQADGHEIAGQTLTHAKLSDLPGPQLRRQVCGDRARLLGNGLAADAFAYPFGAFTARARDVVRACGYTSARLASGIRGAGKVCPRCPYAESIPPRNRFATRMPAGVQRTSTTARLKDAVRDAQRTGGGWVQILVHHVCDGCHRYSITRGRLRRFLDWVATRRGVDVRTVSQVMDTRGPAVRIAAPRAAWRVRRWITIPVRFEARSGVRRVRYFVDGRRVGVRNGPPWRLKLYTGGLRAGRHEVRALLEDGSGNAAISAPRTFVRVTGR